MGSQQSSGDKPDLRVVLVGKTGVGKSATGNTLLGKREFRSEISPVLVTSECQRRTAEFEGQTLTVVDTPGLFNSKMAEEEVRGEMKKCVSLAAPGPHVFLVVIQLNRFTLEEQQTVKLIQQLFGEKASRHTMALITHGDDLEHEGVHIQSFIKENKALNDFVRQCQGGCHVFNNRKEDPGQVRELLEKINQMVQKNGGSYCISEELHEDESCHGKDEGIAQGKSQIRQ